MKWLTTVASMTLLSLSITAQADAYDQPIQRFGQFFTACMEAESEQLDAAEKMVMKGMMKGMMASIMEKMRTKLTEANIPPADFSACVDSMIAVGCAAISAAEPIAGCRPVLDRMK